MGTNEREAEHERGAEEEVSDRSQTSGPPAVPLPPPHPMSDREVDESAEAARRRDPTRETGQAG